MAQEFQHSGICSGNWWNSDRITGSNSLPFSTAPNDVGINNSYVGSWRHNNNTTTTTTDYHHYPISSLEMNKTRSSTDESGGASVSGSSSIVYQDTQKSQESDSVGNEGGGNSSDSILMDSTLQMMGFSLSSSSVPSLDWNNQIYLSNSNRSRNGRADEGDHDQVLKDWSNDLKSFNSCGGSGGEGSSSTITSFKQMNNGFALDQQQQPQSSDCTVTCEGLPTSFPMVSSTLYGCPTTLLQGLFEPDHNLQTQSAASYPDENQSMDFTNPSLTNYLMNSSNDLSSNTTRQKNSHQFHKTTTSPPQQQPTTNDNQSMYFSNDTPFWNASAASLTNGRPSFMPSSQQIQLLTSNFEENKPYPSNHTVKPKKTEEVHDSSSALKKSNNEPSFKRPRIETPLPTFKVRKEKLGDRITALQQLVSPFGKTDTASVLFEAIEYIKFLHDQVSVLSAPYLKNGGAHIQHHHQSSSISRDHNGQGNHHHRQDLGSRGLCLVPISSTFPVTNETATDFWTPTFGGTYR